MSWFRGQKHDFSFLRFAPAQFSRPRKTFLAFKFIPKSHCFCQTFMYHQLFRFFLTICRCEKVMGSPRAKGKGTSQKNPCYYAAAENLIQRPRTDFEKCFCKCQGHFSMHFLSLKIHFSYVYAIKLFKDVFLKLGLGKSKNLLWLTMLLFLIIDTFF